MIDNVYDKKAFSEIIEILNHTDKQLVEKIPNTCIKFLFENMDKEYKPEINFFNENWDETILEDTINDMQLIEIKENAWYKKIWKKIISFFGIK